MVISKPPTSGSRRNMATMDWWTGRSSTRSFDQKPILRDVLAWNSLLSVTHSISVLSLDVSTQMLGTETRVTVIHQVVLNSNRGRVKL